MRGNMSLPTASTVKGVWSLGLFEGVDLVPASEELDITLKETAVCRLTEDRGYN